MPDAGAKLDRWITELRRLDDAVRYGRGNLGWIEHDPDLDALHDDPRFRAIVDRLHRVAVEVGTTSGARS
jgi:hypothetical protein